MSSASCSSWGPGPSGSAATPATLRSAAAAPTPRSRSCPTASWSNCSSAPSPPGPPRRRSTARVDLHCHSTASDGELPPAEVVELAQEAGLAAIALTDHDTIAGVADAARAGAALGVRVVCGCEFSVKAPWGELHLLGYFLEAADAPLADFLTTTQAARRRRAEQMVSRLQRLGVAIDVDAVVTEAGGGA